MRCSQARQRRTDRTVQGMTDKKVVPYKSKWDRRTQIRSLLMSGKTIKQLVEMGFILSEATEAKIALNKKADRVRVDTGYKPKDLVRCKGCGGMASKSTLQNGVCLGCVCRDRTNFERKVRFRV